MHGKLSLIRLGDFEEGESALKKAISLAGNDFVEPYYDLAVIYYERGEYNKALELLNDGIKRAPKLREVAKGLFEKLTVLQ